MTVPRRLKQQLERASIQLYCGKFRNPVTGVYEPYWGTGFFFSHDLVFTADHNLRGSRRRGGEFTAVYRGRDIKLRWLREWSSEPVDIAVLELLEKPDDVAVEPVAAAYLDDDATDQERRHYFGGRSVLVFGFPCTARGLAGRHIDGAAIDNGEPFTIYTEPDPRGRVKWQEERLVIRGSRLHGLEGISGACVMDVEEGLAIGVENMYTPETPDKEVFASEIGRLVPRCPDLKPYLRVLQVSPRGWARGPVGFPHPAFVPVGPADPRPYLEHLARESRYVRLDGIGATEALRPAALRLPVGRVFPESFELRQVYTRLRIAAPAGGRGAAAAGAADAQAPGREASDHALEEVLADYPQAVLVGDPGSGKTTFLGFVSRNLALALHGPSGLDAAERAAVERARDWLREARLDSEPPFPILVRLSELARFLEDPPVDLGRLTNPADPAYFHGFLDRQGTWLRERVESGGCYLLLDGLDEVPGDAMRGRIVSLVRELVEKGNRSNRYLITCRTRAFHGKALLGGEFATFHLQPFRRRQLKAFAERWCRALFAVPEDATAGKDLARAIAYAGQMVQDILAHPDALKLASTPLMLTILAVVHVRRNGQLPRQRVELYEEAVSYLLEKRDDLAQLALPAPLREASIVERREYFQELALLMREGPEGPRRQLGRREAAMLAARRFDFGQREAQAFVESEELRSGVLVSRDVGEVEFWHLSFQEYLAARALADDPAYWDRIKDHLHDDQWSEVVLLLAASLRWRNGREAASDLIRLILAHDSTSRSGKARAVGLVGRIVRDIHAYEGKPEEGTGYDQVLEDTLSVFEPGGEEVDERTRVEVGEALGQAGDPRLAAPEKNRVLIKGNDQDAEERRTARVRVSDFLLGRYPVTVSEYAKFVDLGEDGYLNRLHWSDEGWAWREREGREKPREWEEQLAHLNRPVTTVTWYEAEAYCTWDEGRLPTEAEWEWAAAGATGREYPWGDEEPDDRHANFDRRLDHATPVGIYPLGATPEGVQDMAGNVWEWCADEHRETGMVTQFEGVPARVLRGGSFYNYRDDLRSAARYSNRPGISADGGFRVAWSSPGGQG